jgi:hypothetical protein
LEQQTVARGARLDCRFTVGIDPGKAGGICVLLGQMIYKLVPMPETLKEVRLLFATLPDAAWGVQNRILIEDLSGRPSPGVTAVRAMALNLGRLEGLFTGMGLPYEKVLAVTWQSLMYSDPRLAGLEGKARSIAAARILEPGIDLLPSHRARKPSDGMADAYLIARYGLAVGRTSEAAG